MDQLERHLNLVNMIGACTAKFKSGKIWLILEYCSHGDMKTFLLRNRDVINQVLHYRSIPHEDLNIRLFLNPKGDGGDQSVPSVRRLAPISQRIIH